MRLISNMRFLASCVCIRYYRNVHIDPSALALLPENDDLSGLHSMTVDSPSDDSELSSTQDVDPYDANLSRTFIPLTPPRMTEQEAIRQSVQERQSNLPSTVAWPPAGETPINEFRTEGYISSAFPTLFPTGAADFVAPRACPVTIGNYFLMYEDGQFPRHLRFCYFALNTEMRWCALQTGRICV